MKTIKTPISPDLKGYPIEKLGNPEELLFIDIETTGFSAEDSSIYLIGCVYIEGGSCHAIQWLAEGLSEEEDVLYSFYNFATSYKTLVHFNGNSFDIPFIQKRSEALELPFDLRIFSGIDIYKRLKPFKSFLKMPSMKQRSIEELLGIEREDILGGKELVRVSQEYLESPTDENAELLLHHNLCDIKGLIGIVPMLSVSDMFNESLKVTKAGRNPYTDSDGVTRSEVIMEFMLPSPVPIQISYGFSDCYFTGEGAKGKIRVSVFEGELKYFYPNYRDYYYIPAQDIAVHKDVASYMDPSQRVQAKASTCYTRKSGTFLPQWEPLFSPVMRRSYNEPTMYFELSDEFKRNAKGFNAYAAHLLDTLIAF